MLLGELNKEKNDLNNKKLIRHSAIIIQKNIKTFLTKNWFIKNKYI